MFQRDTIYDHVQNVVDFNFDDKIAAVFPDMVHRSIPAYSSLLQLIAVICAYEKPRRIYDLGCALGGSSFAITRLLPDVEIIAVDNSAAMLKRFQIVLDAEKIKNIQLVEADICEMEFSQADIFVMNYTLQFVAPEKRNQLLKKIFFSLNTGGLLLLAEKINSTERLQAWHQQFKLSQGYSELEIAQKRTAIENVMKIDTKKMIEHRLHEAGFLVQEIQQALNFAAWAGFKS